MKTNIFTYETGLGTFWIRPEPAGRVQLGIGRNELKTYRSATTAARDVAERTTGWAPWDNTTAKGNRTTHGIGTDQGGGSKAPRKENGGGGKGASKASASKGSKKLPSSNR